MCAKSYNIYDDVVETLDVLNSLNIKLGIISNSDIRSLYILEILNLSKYFSTVILSQSEQISKPDKRLFMKGFNNLSGIHVGDSLEKDYYGAKRCGIDGLLLVRDGCVNQRINYSNQISNLKEIINKYTQDLN
jgi:HAD superfamily hydrolase (TIGR01549 family)